jgi:hypothetical protein
MSITQKNLAQVVEKIVQSARIVDFHTHLFTPCHGELCWWGIDDLLIYHYLVAETFRYVDMPYDKFWALSKAAQADLIWKTLFVERTPLSEACRGVITCLNRLGLDHRTKDIRPLRRFYDGFTAGKFIDKIFSLGRIVTAVLGAVTFTFPLFADPKSQENRVKFATPPGTLKP